LFAHRRLPLLYVYSDTDERVDSRLSAEFAALLGAEPNAADVYDAEGQPTHLQSKSGSHLQILAAPYGLQGGNVP